MLIVLVFLPPEGALNDPTIGVEERDPTAGWGRNLPHHGARNPGDS